MYILITMSSAQTANLSVSDSSSLSRLGQSVSSRVGKIKEWNWGNIIFYGLVLIAAGGLLYLIGSTMSNNKNKNQPMMTQADCKRLLVATNPQFGEQEDQLAP